MTLFLKRFVASLTAGTLAFSAVPAFALGLHLDSSAKADGSLMLSRCKQIEDSEDRAECERRVQLHLEAKQNASVRSNKDDSHGEFKSDTRAKVNVLANVENRERLWNRTVMLLEHGIKRVGSVARKFCRAENPESSAVASCMNRLKTSFKAKVDAAINAAFTI